MESKDIIAHIALFSIFFTFFNENTITTQKYHNSFHNNVLSFMSNINFLIFDNALVCNYSDA